MAPASRDPYPGWVDSLNGPIGIFVAGASGVLRIIYVNPENTPDLVPVDFACNSFIAAASHIGQLTELKKDDQYELNHNHKMVMVENEQKGLKEVDDENDQIAEMCPVFNCTVSSQAPVTWRELITVGLEV